MKKLYKTDLRYSIAEVLRDRGEASLSDLRQALDMVDSMPVYRAVTRLIELKAVERSGVPHHYTYRLSLKGFNAFFGEQDHAV